MTLYRCPDSAVYSNFSVEAFHLIGWLPQVFWFSECHDLDRLWDILEKGLRRGHILAALGTEFDSSTSSRIDPRTNLVQNHIYPILGATPGRVLRCMNPWGRLSPRFAHPTLAVPAAAAEDKGLFWTGWNAVTNSFSHLCLAINPDQYSCRHTVHFKGRTCGRDPVFDNEKYSLAGNPQFVLTLSAHKCDTEVRILLERHVSNLGEGAKVGFRLFSYEGRRIVYPNGSLYSTAYSSREVFSDVFVAAASVSK